MSRPKYFIKTTVKVYGGRTKYEVVKGFSDADSIAKVGSERDATRLCEEFERLTDENAAMFAAVERRNKAIDEADDKLKLLAEWAVFSEINSAEINQVREILRKVYVGMEGKQS